MNSNQCIMIEMEGGYDECEKLKKRILPSQMDSKASMGLAEPIDLTGMQDLCDVHDRVQKDVQTVNVKVRQQII